MLAAFIFPVISSCATQYDSFREISLRGLTREQASDRLEGLGIPFYFQTCERALSFSDRPLAQCHHTASLGIIRALANDGFYLMGIGTSDVQLYIELDTSETVIEVREETVNSL